MRELRVKDTLLVDKDIEIRRDRKELKYSVRQAREDVCREIEVGLWCVVLFPTVFVQDVKKIYGCDKGGYDDGWQVC